MTVHFIDKPNAAKPAVKRLCQHWVYTRSEKAIHLSRLGIPINDGIFSRAHLFYNGEMADYRIGKEFQPACLPAKYQVAH